MSLHILYTILTLSIAGIIAAILLFLVARKFTVKEDCRISELEEILPGANCGSCGYSGCRAFAEACLKANDLNDLNCTVGGQDIMDKIAAFLGVKMVEKDRYLAVVRCSGSDENCRGINIYNGAESCAIANNLYFGETECFYGCLKLGDCVKACPYNAIHLDADSGLPVISDEVCRACGACVEACPRSIIELHKVGKNGRRVYVSCVNQDKGGIARNICTNACIGCGKCVKECKFDAITIKNFVAYIDPGKCRLCRKCVAVCPTGAIREEGFMSKKGYAERQETEKEKSNQKELKSCYSGS